MTETTAAPAVTGFHHFSPTVSDVEASAQWYERVFGMSRVPVTFPHYGAEQEGYAVLLIDPRSGIAIGLHHHEANPGQPFHESRTGLDHMSFGVADRASLDSWASWLDELGVEHSGVIDCQMLATLVRRNAARPWRASKLKVPAARTTTTIRPIVEVSLM